MMSIALTKEVVTKGKIKVSHSQWEKMANPNAAVEAKKTNHQIPFCFVEFAMVNNLRKATTSCELIMYSGFFSGFE